MKRAIIFGLLFSALAAGVFASDGDGIFSFKIGQLELCMLVESERDGNTGIIPGADADLLKRFIPASGFKHTANAFLIKGPGQNLLVDTGTGANGVIIDKLKKLGVEKEKLDAVLITHLHGDHSGSLQSGGLANFPKAKVYLDAKEYEHFTKTAVNQGAVAALTPYGSGVITFNAGNLGSPLKEILPGISPVAAYGHTPGHTAFLVESGGEKILIAGDFLHVALIQFPNPDISATYDMDQKAAAASRRELMEYAAKNKIPLGGMHVVYPGIGKVEAEGSGYRFSPLK
jgi:glyoxylase-like metal-dependent hydrolase (beta-lactamase superfamily II)